MRIECMQTGALLAARAAGLDEADRLRVEDHLTGCADCRAMATGLVGLAALVERAPLLRPAARERAVAAALAAPAAETVPFARQPSRRGTVALGFAAAAALALAGWWGIQQHRADADRDARAVARSTSPATEPAPAPPTAVEPAATSGQPATGATSADTPAASTEVTSAQLELPELAAQERTAVPVVERATVVDEPWSAADWLRRARKSLAAGELAAAGRAIDHALRNAPSRRQRAEAATLRADLARIAGDSQRARALYLAVADDYAGSRAAENALLAAGRLANADGDTAGAQRIWRRYLTDYPDGAFADDVTRRLGE